MTSAEMISLFKLKYDAAGSSAAPDFTKTEIYKFLNDSQLEIVDMLHSSRNYTLLGNIVISEHALPTDQYVVNYYRNPKWLMLKTSSPLSNYRYYVNSFSTIFKIGASSAVIVPNEYISVSDVERFLWTDNNKPRFNKCVIFENKIGAGDCLIALADAYTDRIQTVSLTYLRNPSTISDSNPCELDQSLHEKIVKLAVDKTVESVYKSKVPPTQNQKEGK